MALLNLTEPKEQQNEKVKENDRNWFSRRQQVIKLWKLWSHFYLYDYLVRTWNRLTFSFFGNLFCGLENVHINRFVFYIH